MPRPARVSPDRILAAAALEFAARGDAGAGTAAADAADPLPLAGFARAWSLDLRRPLTDSPQPASQPGVANAGLPVRLVGTILDPARPRGIFVTPLGQTELKAAGEKVAGVEVLRVEERSATLSIAGQPVTIKVEKVETILPAAPDPSQPPSARGKSVR
jgi:hypothetical protein